MYKQKYNTSHNIDINYLLSNSCNVYRIYYGVYWSKRKKLLWYNLMVMGFSRISIYNHRIWLVIGIDVFDIMDKIANSKYIILELSHRRKWPIKNKYAHMQRMRTYQKKWYASLLYLWHLYWRLWSPLSIHWYLYRRPKYEVFDFYAYLRWTIILLLWFSNDDYYRNLV